MNKEVKALWVEALRSGDYTQGFATLRTQTNEYCCLGVLCEIAVKQGIIPEAEPFGHHYAYGDDVHTSSAFLPDTVREWAGLDTREPILTTPVLDGIRALSVLNDSGKASFQYIADLIERDF